MANVLKYIGNVSKSVVYSAVDQVKELNPAIAEAVELNSDLTKMVYESIKDYKGTVRRAKDFVIQSDVGEAAIQMKKSILEDLKTGQFYNRKRIDEMEIKASGGLLDFDNMEDPFADMDDDNSWDVDSDDWSASLDDQFLAEAMDATGEKITTGLAEATFKSADYIVGSNKQSFRMMQQHNEFLANKIGSHIGAVNSSIGTLIEFNNKAMTTHINNSQKFYDVTTTTLQKQLELLEKIAKNTEVGTYGVEQKKSSRITFNDIVGSEGLPDLKLYAKMVADNIMDNTGGLLDLNKAMGGNMLMMLAGSPLKVVTDSLVKKVIPKSLESVTKSFNETLSGTFSSLMVKAEKVAAESDNDFFRKLGEILGTNTSVRNSVDVAKYNRGAIPFDGETKIAIQNISTQISKITSILSGKPMQIFDYATGKWTSYDEINRMYGAENRIKSASKSASSDLRSKFDEMLERVNFGSASAKKTVMESIDNMFLEAFKSGGLIGFNDKDVMDFTRMKNIDYDAVKYIVPMLKQIQKENRSLLMKYNNELMRARHNHNNNMKSIEDSPSSIDRILYNNFNPDEFVQRDSKGKIINNPYDYKDYKNGKVAAGGLGGGNLITVRDNKGKNIFDYLQKTIWELEYMRKNGGGFGGGRGRRNGQPQEIIMPEPFENKSYMASHKNLDEIHRKEELDAEVRYERELERMYEKEWKRKEKGDYSKPVFDSLIQTDADEDEQMRMFSRYLDENTYFKKIEAMRKENNRKNEKRQNRPGWIKAFFDSDNVDERVKTFMEGVMDLSQKPEEFLARMVERTDKQLYTIIYGDEDDDKLTTKTFMGSLMSRLTATFANFNDFLRDDFLEPLKYELFGNNGVFSSAKRMLSDKVNIDTGNLKKNIKEFVMGTYEIDPTTGERHRINPGMFGGKIDYIKNNMKDVYRTPINSIKEYAKGEAKDPYQLEILQERNREIERRNKEANKRAAGSAFRFIDDKYFDEATQTIDPRIISSREEVMREMAERVARGEEIPNYYNGGYIRKTGIAAVSEGEMIIPAEFNPFYKGKVNKAEQRAKENSAKRDFSRYINGLGSSKLDAYDIPGYADGSAALADVVELPVGRESKTRRKQQKSVSSSDDAAAAGASIKRGSDFEVNTEELYNLREQYVTGKESIGYKIGDEVKNLFGFFSAIGLNKKNVTERLSKASETFAASAEKISNQMAQAVGEGQDSQVLYNNMIKDVKGGFSKYFPSMLGGGLVGAGVSLVTGAVGGPLLGAAIGSATDLVVSSGKVQDWLFGEIGNDGKRRGNIISKDLANNIEKYFPDMAKGAVVGGITSILPFVPGGPVAGIVLGSSIGFAKNNDRIQKMLFGDDENEGIFSKDLQDTVKKAVPASILGGAIGAFTGPFGFVGNIALGSAIGFATKTKTFEHLIFGKENEDGETEGGLVNAIKNGFVNPIIDFGGSFADRVHDWFKNDVADRIVSSIAPLGRQGRLLVDKVAGAIGTKMEDMIDDEMGSLRMPFGTWFNNRVVKPAGNIARGTINALSYPAGRIISSPFRMIGSIGDYYRGKHVANGNANYMTAAERLRYREEVANRVTYERYTKDERDEDGNLIHRKGEFVIGEDGEPIVKRKRGFGLFNELSTGRRNRKDKFRQFDEMLVNTDIEDLQSMSDSIAYLQNPNNVAKKLKYQSADRIKHSLSGKVSFNVQNNILKSLDNGDFEGAMETLRRAGLEPNERRKLTQLITQEYSNYQTANQLISDEKGSRNRIYAQLRKLGFKDLSDKTLGKYKGLLDQEINNKADEKSEIEKLNENQDNRHNEIVDLFKSVIDELHAIRDPKYAEKIASDNFEKNMAEASKKRGIFRFMDSGNSGLFGNYSYHAEMGSDGKLHYYRVDSHNNKQLVDEQGRPIDEDGNFLIDEYDDKELYYMNNDSASNTDSRNAYLKGKNKVLAGLYSAKDSLGRLGNKVKGVGKRAWNGATYEERAELRNEKYQKEQEHWKKRLLKAGIAIPENYTGSYKELWKQHFYGYNNLKSQEESEDVKYVADSSGNPIKWVKNSEGQWETDTNDAETKNYLSAGDKTYALLQKTTDKLSDIGTTLKDGFLNLFNIDKERDGWLKSMLKIGGGVLGALTIAGFGPILENWYDNTAKPAIHNFWEEKVAPTLGRWLEPVKPTIARAAVGIDGVVRSVPVAIDNLGTRIKNFFSNQFPDIMANKIIPFYKNGIDWLGEKTAFITEKATQLMLQIAPRIIYGSIKGAWNFMKNDIFTLFGGLGRRDAKSLMKSTTSVSKSSNGNINRTSKSSLSNFSFFSNAYKSITGETPEQTLGRTPSNNELEKYYNGEGSYPTVKYTTLSGSSETGARQTNTQYKPYTETKAFSNIASPSDYENYAASFGASATLDSGFVSEYDRSVNEEVSPNTAYQSNAGYKNTSTISNWNRTSIEQANAEMNGFTPVSSNGQFVVDTNTSEVYDENGETVGWTNGNEIFTYDGKKYGNESVKALLDPNNMSIAGMGAKAAVRAFMQGSGSVLTKSIANFGKSSKLLNSNIVTKTVRRSINSVGGVIEKSGKLGGKIQNILTGRLVPSSYDNLLQATTAGSAKSIVNANYQKLIGEALNAGFSADEAVEWAKANLGGSLNNMYTEAYKGVDDVAARLGSKVTSAGIANTKNLLAGSIDDLTEGVIKSTSKEAAERVISTVGDATTSSGFMKTISKKITSFFEGITKNGVIKKYLSKSMIAAGQSATDDAVEAGLKALSKEGSEALIETFAGTLAKGGSKFLKVLGEYAPFIGIAFSIYDFYDGFSNAGAYLGLLQDDVPIWGKFVCGIAQLINGKLTLGLIPLSVIVELFVKILAPIFSIDLSEFESLREEAGRELQEFNEKNGSDLDLKQYNKRHNIFTRVGSKIASIFTGKDKYGSLVELDGDSESEYSKSIKNFSPKNYVNGDMSFANAVGTGSGITGLSNNTNSSDNKLICQNSPRYASMRFNTNEDSEYQTLGDSGCAPASAAMVVNTINGTDITLPEAASDALRSKEVNGGVKASYFNDFFNKNGLQAHYTDGSKNIISMLKSTKNPVVLLGQDANNSTKSTSPFGPNNHYVVATGINNDGSRIYINDPEQSKPNISYSTNILKNVQVGIGATKGIIGRAVPKRFSGLIGAGSTSLPGIGFKKASNSFKSLKSLSRGISLSGRGSTYRDTYNELTEGMEAPEVMEGRNTYILNEIVTAIMTLESSINLSAVNYNADKDGNISVGIMQWKGKDVGVLLSKILTKNPNSGKTILGPSSTLYHAAERKSAITGKSLTNTSRSNLTTFLSSNESKEIQLAEAKTTALNLLNKCPFTNPRTIIMWAAIYNHDNNLGNQLSNLIGNTLEKDSGVNSVYAALKELPGFETMKEKYVILYSFCKTSVCEEISNSFDSNLLASIVTATETGQSENNFLSKIFDAITNIGKAYFGISTNKKASSDNLDDTLSSLYSTAEEYNLDPTTVEAMEPYIITANDREKLLIDRLRAVSKMINIDKYAAIIVFQMDATDLYNFLSEFEVFDEYITLGDEMTDSIVNAKCSFLNPDSLVKAIKEECLDKLNKYDYSVSKDLAVNENEAFENTTIYSLFQTQIRYFEAFGSTKDCKGIKYSTTVNRSARNGVTNINKAQTKGTGAFDNDFFNYRMVNNRTLINKISKMSSRVEIINYLEDYIKSSLQDALNNGEFFSSDDVSRFELRDALSVLSSDEYSLDAKEAAWNDAEAILTTSFVNNPNVSKADLIKILNEYDTHDFDYMKSSDYRVNTSSSSVSASKNTGFGLNRNTLFNSKNVTIQQLAGVLNKPVSGSITNGSSLSKLGLAEMTQKYIGSKAGSVTFQSSGKAINPYTAQRALKARTLAELNKKSQLLSCEENAINTFENLSKIRWLYKTDQGASSSDLDGFLYKSNITHPKGPRISDSEHNKYRELFADQIAILGDDPAINRGDGYGRFIQSMLSNDTMTGSDIYKSFLAYYDLWKSDPKSVGGPFEKGFKFNKMEWFDARAKANNSNNDKTLNNAASLQELIASEILGDTTKTYTASDSPLARYNNELQQYIASRKQNKTINPFRLSQLPIQTKAEKEIDREIEVMPPSIFKDNMIQHKDELVLKRMNEDLNSPMSARERIFNTGNNLSGKGSFVSQYDYGSKTFSDGESLAQAGCGPAVASMVLNSARGTTPIMDYAAKVADKYKDEGGTQATYFNDIFGRAGMSTEYIGNNVKSGIKNHLESGQQVVVMGRDVNNTSKANSPFGMGNHYVLATGIGRGKVMINDPEQSGPRVYSDKILNNASLGVAVGKGSFMGINRKFKNFVGGKTNWDPQKVLHQDLKAYGYDSVSAEDLNAWVKSKHANSFWADKGQVIIKASKETGLDPRYILAHAIHETGWTVSKIARDKNNFFGIGAFDASPYASAYNWTGVEAGIIGGAKWIEEHYYSSSYHQNTIYKMRHNGGTHEYATDSGWADKIANIWSSMPLATTGANPNVDMYSYSGDSSFTTTDATVEETPEEKSWLDQITSGIERLGKAYFGIGNSPTFSTSSNSSSTLPLSSGNQIVDEARTYIGKLPYVWGGESLTSGADCSGFTSALYKKFGITIPRTGNEQWKQGSKVNRDQLQAGDIVCFSDDGQNGSRCTHVGIFTGNNSYVHSPQTGEYVKESSYDPNSWGYTHALGGVRFTASASGSGIKASTSKQYLAKALSKMNIQNPNKVVTNTNPSINTNKAVYNGNKSLPNVNRLISQPKPVSKPISVVNQSGKGNNTGLDSGIIYDALTTIISLLGQTVTNTSYTAKVAELVELVNTYLDKKSVPVTAKGTESKSSNVKVSQSKSSNNTGAGYHSGSEYDKLQSTIARLKKQISN